MYDLETRISREGGVWLHCSAAVPVRPDRAFEEVATAEGISAWFAPTSLEPQVDGAIVQFVGGDGGHEESATHGVVTAYDPPLEFAYVEEDWMGPGMPAPPWITRFEITPERGVSDRVDLGARVRMRSGFESATELTESSVEESWLAWHQAMLCMIHRLSVFPEGRVRTLQVTGARNEISVEELWSLLLSNLDLPAEPETGSPFSCCGVSGTLIHEAAGGAVLAVSEPTIGTLNLFAYPDGDDAAEAASHSSLSARFTEFVPDSAAAPKWSAKAWSEWLEMVEEPVDND